MTNPLWPLLAKGSLLKAMVVEIYRDSGWGGSYDSYSSNGKGHGPFKKCTNRGMANHTADTY